MLHINVKVILSAFQRRAACFSTLSIVVMALKNVIVLFFAHPLIVIEISFNFQISVDFLIKKEMTIQSSFFILLKNVSRRSKMITIKLAWLEPRLDMIFKKKYFHIPILYQTKGRFLLIMQINNQNR